MTRKLLVADDSATIQTVVNLTFAEEDVQIEAVSSGDQALERTKRIKPDIVLADVFMPGFSGYEVCERIKADPELRHIPVVLLVGTFEPFDRDEAERVKFDGYLTKPFDTSELIETVRSLIGESRERSVPMTEGKTGPPLHPVEHAAFPSESLVTERSRESFAGANPILDVFGASFPSVSARTRPRAAMPQEILRNLVEGIVRQISPDIVREVAWEVVPELSEMLIRQKLDQKEPN